MLKRLSTKLIVSLTILVVVVAGIFGLLNIRLQERQLLDNMVVGADQLSQSISSATWHAMLADNRPVAYEVMQTIAEKQGISRIRIFNKDGRVMFSTVPNDVAMVNKRAEACFVCHAAEQPLIRVKAPSRARVFKGSDGKRMLGMVTPIYNETSCSTAPCHAHPASRAVLGVLDVSLDLGRVDEELAGLKRQSVLLVSVEIVLIGAFITLLTRKLVDRPIRKLIHGTKEVAAMRLDTPIELRASQELEELAESFNVMQERLKHAVEDLHTFNEQLETKVEERTHQLRLAQQKLIQSDRLASLGQLAASVAHEINNPISGVLNLSVLLRRILREDGIPEGRVEEFRDYLSQISTETTRVGRIVSDLLAFSRRSRPHREAADLNAIIRSTLSLVGHKMLLAHAREEVELDESLPRISCDASQIQQVVVNLIVNAVEALHGEGVVRVTTGTEAGGERVILEVSDTGTGIAPEHMNKIFDPFFTTKEEGKGTGLGLAVVYGIVEAHGGDVEVDSAPGRGTTFRVILPVLAHESVPQTGGPAGSAAPVTPAARGSAG